MSLTMHQRVAFFIAFVILATGVVGVVGRNLDEDESSALTFPSPTATAIATVAPTPAATQAPPAKTAPPTAAPAPTPAVVTAPPGGAANMPKAGLYTFKETGGGRFTQSTLRITDAGPGAQKEGIDNVVSDTSWRSNGKFLTQTTYGAPPPPNGFSCNWEPDVLQIKLPLVMGETWTFSGSCELVPGATIRISGTGMVTGTEQLTIGDRRVDTYRLHMTATVRGEGNGESFEQRLSGDENFAPGPGLTVRSVAKTEGTDPFTGEPSNSTTEEELVSLTPQPV